MFAGRAIVIEAAPDPPAEDGAGKGTGDVDGLGGAEGVAGTTDMGGATSVGVGGAPEIFAGGVALDWGVAFPAVAAAGVLIGSPWSVSDGSTESGVSGGGVKPKIRCSSGSSSSLNRSGSPVAFGAMMRARRRRSAAEMRAPSAGAAWSNAISASPAEMNDRNSSAWSPSSPCAAAVRTTSRSCRH